jgi:hypothetical protein
LADRANQRHTARSAKEMAAFTATVTAGIAAQRQQERAQAAPAAQPHEGIQDVSTDAAQDRAQDAREPTEREKGAATARLIVLRQIEAGQSADQIAGRWESALAEHDPAVATAAQQAWHDGAQDEAAQLIQDWRDMEREEAEQAQANRDARDAGQSAGQAGGWELTADELASLDRQDAAPEPDPEPEMEAAG